MVDCEQSKILTAIERKKPSAPPAFACSAANDQQNAYVRRRLGRRFTERGGMNPVRVGEERDIGTK